MNKNKILSGGGKNLTGGGKWGWRGREVGGEGEGSGVKGGGKWGLGTPCPPPHVFSTYFLRGKNQGLAYHVLTRYSRYVFYQALFGFLGMRMSKVELKEFTFDYF